MGHSLQSQQMACYEKHGHTKGVSINFCWCEGGALDLQHFLLAWALYILSSGPTAFVFLVEATEYYSKAAERVARAFSLLWSFGDTKLVKA